MEVRISRISTRCRAPDPAQTFFKACCWPWSLLCVGSQEELYLTCLIGGVGVGFLIKGFGGKKSLFGGVGVGS